MEREEPNNNVLFAPERDEFTSSDGASSVRTNPGTKTFVKGGGVAVTDESVLKASKILCCLCGVMTMPN